MSMENVGKLIDRWMTDSAFRAQMRNDPEGTLKASGAKCSAEEMTAFRQIDWKLNDEELKSRVSKAFV